MFDPAYNDAESVESVAVVLLIQNPVVELQV